MRAIFSIILLSLSISCFAQTDTLSSEDKIAEMFRYNSLVYSKTANKKWAKSKRTVTYENQGQLHSIYLALNADFTFEFLAFYEPGMFLTLGNWTKRNDSTILLNWSRELSNKYWEKPELKKKYSEYASLANPMKISNWTFIMRKGRLIPSQEPMIDKAANTAFSNTGRRIDFQHKNCYFASKNKYG